MSTWGDFKYESCLLKHYVRVKGWLPNCQARQQQLSHARVGRRLRYFTFCAIGAIDVLMLEIANVITKSGDDEFDSVVFFDRDSEAVTETQKRIKGAVGFPGRFTSVVLAGGLEPDVPDETDTLAPPTNAEDTLATRARQRTLFQRDQFMAQFPFDVINLDLEEFAFKANDPFPGDVVRAIRKLATWQKRSLSVDTSRGRRMITVDGFTLMFTTQIGPPNMTEEYKAMLRDYIERNIRRKPELLVVLRDRIGIDEVATLERDRFDEFFKIGVRKVLADVLLEMDWYIDPEEGIKTFEFTRAFDGGEYTILHFVMEVKRQAPDANHRAPNSTAPDALDAFASVAEDLFARPVERVTDEVAKAVALKPTIEQIVALRRKYYPEPT